MEELLKEIRLGLDNRMYLLGLFSALTLPDICGAVGSPNGEAKGNKFKNWYNTYVAPNYDQLSAEECYEFRCKVLHQGHTFSDDPSKYSQIIFAEPVAASGTFSINMNSSEIGGVIGPRSIDVLKFINTIIEGVETWIAQNRGTEPFDTNFAKCMTRHPEGYPPLFGGIPMIY